MFSFLNPAKLFAFAEDAVRMGTKKGREAMSTKGFLRGATLGESFKHGLGAATGGYMFAQLPLSMYAAGRAERGHKLSTFAGHAMPFLATGLVTGLLGGWAGMAAGMALDPLVEKAVSKPLQMVADLGMRAHRLSTGGDYRDTQAAFTMRMAAVQQLSTSLLSAREYLGKEALLMHDGG